MGGYVFPGSQAHYESKAVNAPNRLLRELLGHLFTLLPMCRSLLYNISMSHCIVFALLSMPPHTYTDGGQVSIMGGKMSCPVLAISSV
jgi:hypothetical protein